MTATILAPPTQPSVVWFHSGDFGFEPTKKFTMAGGRNVLQLKDVPVFRSGEFRNSMGDLNTWEDLHLSQMQSNFEYLKANGTLPNIPVRKGHGSFLSEPMDSLVGWHDSVHTEQMKSPVDGLSYTYLLADYYIFDQEAAERVDAGDWPNRSAEIGGYTSNNQTQYWPLYMGFAYVDIPAVEGLNFSKYQKEAGGKLSILVDDLKEFSVTNPVVPPVAPPVAPVLPVVPATETHSAPAAVPFSFSLFGTVSSDFAAVQAHITRLESEKTLNDQFKKEQATAARDNFVAGLAAGDTPKILQGQVEGMKAHVQTLDDSQFAAFKTIYDGLPGIGVLQQHGNSNGTGNPIIAGAGTKDEKGERISVLTEMVDRHRLAGVMSEEQITKTNSYVELQRLKASS